MADVPAAGSGGTSEAGILLGAALRAGVAAVGLAGGLLAAGYSLYTGRGLGPGLLALLYLCTVMLVWGATGMVRRTPLRAGPLLAISAGICAVLLLAGFALLQFAGPPVHRALGRLAALVFLPDLLFYSFAALTLAGGAGCAFSRSIIYSAWSLLFAFLGVAGLYVFLGADFPAVAQVLIYVGGILVLILFAIMLTKQIGEEPQLTNTHVSLPAGALLGLAMAGLLGYLVVLAPWKLADRLSWEPTTQGLGVAFLTDWLLPFEVASVVLLAALVGAVVIARKEIKETSDTSL